jgi:DNA repair exonuclease SbcCD ATPase subunit
MIQFKNVKFKNFGSFGNYFTTVSFENNQMTLVTGSNGHGKSYALLDSITFALFGKPFRKINIPQLVNSINNKNCVVHLTFDIGSNSYEVVRGLKPKRFEIYKNGELIQQNAKSKDYQRFLEEQILKMNYKSFTQIVTLGSSSFVPFMQLTAADRREVIEDILNINIFSTMNVVIKGKMSSVKEKIIETHKNLEILKEKQNIQIDNIKTLKSKQQQTISTNIKKIEETETEIDNLLKEIQILEDTVKDFSTHKSRQETLNNQMVSHKDKIVSSIKKRKQKEENKDFYVKNESCPVCSQSITEEFKQTKINELEEEIKIREEKTEQLKKNFYSIKEEYDSLQQILDELSDVNFSIAEKTNSISAARKFISSLKQNDISHDSFQESIAESETKKQEYQNDIVKIEQEMEKLKEEKSNLDILSLLLKDSGIKAKIIKNYLPIINEIINKYLSQMNFSVSFTLDEEFTEHIKSRHRDSFGYMNFSEGEKARIDLAILLAWREIAKIKNSAHCNILILDEVFDSSMDSMGVDDLMKVLRNLSNNGNIFVITHKTDQLYEKFHKVISFKKKNNFSKMSSK